MDEPYNMRILNVCNFELNMAEMKKAVVGKRRCLFIQEHNKQLFKNEFTYAFSFCARNDILYSNYSEQHCLTSKCQNKTAKPAKC